MPINVYTGLMRSGKSYEVVSEVVVPAIRAGRRVVTNIDGISGERIIEYLKKKHPNDEHEKYGSVLLVTNGQVFDEKFFPYYDDQKTAHTDTIVQPGDLVAIDEAWRFWGDKMKMHKNHQSFVVEHGHFTHPVTHVACDIALMVQDMGMLNKYVKNVVAFTYRTNKKVSLGLSKVYSLNMWEGKSLVKANHIGQWTRTYKADVFPLYSSFKGGAEGVMVNVDKRQNVLRNWKLWAGLVIAIIVAVVAFRNVWNFFHPEDPKSAAKGAQSTAGGPSGSGSQNVPSQPSRPSTPSFSDTWRIVGNFDDAKGQPWVVVSNSAGALRVESPSMFNSAGMAQTGEIDGSKVSVFSGGPLPKSSGIGAAPAQATQGALGEVRK